MIRELILRISATTSVISLLLLPLVAHSSRLQSSGQNAIVRIVRATSFSHTGDIPVIHISRDPFVPLASAVKPLQEETNVVVRAIALGAQPAALIDENGKARLIEIGDAIAGSRVTALTGREITLADGRHFALPVQQ